jgi:two-component system KDP operon response regulator KdpE
MKILVIDDDPATTDVIKLILQTTTSFIMTTNSPKEGIEITWKKNPDIILMDLMMDEMDGWDVCREIRKFSTIPIMIISAVDSPGLIARVLDAGADDYIVKPINNEILVAHINKVVRRNLLPGGLVQLATY